MMKIILLSRVIGYNVMDGILRYTLLIDKLLTREKIRKQLFLFTGSYGLGSTVKHIPLLVKIFLKIMKELGKDIVVLHALVPSIYCILIPFFRRRFIVTIHDLEPVFYRRRLIERLLYKIIWKISTYSRIVIVVSSQTQEELIKYFRLKKEKIRIIYPPIREFGNNYFESKSRGKLVIGYFSPTHVRKGFNLALMVFKKFREKYPDINCELHIYGRITEIDPYRLAQKYGLSDSIEIHGSIPENNVRRMLESLDVLLFTSLYEGFGMPIVEASSLGVPVLLFKKAKIPSETREVGVQCTSIDDMVDKLYLIASDENVFNEFRKEAVEKAKKFIERDVCEELLRVYIQAVRE